MFENNSKLGGAQVCNLVDWCRMSRATILHCSVSVHLSVCKLDMSEGYK